MKKLLAFAILSLIVCAKDNFVFDYRADPDTENRVERIEREASELKTVVTKLQADQKALAQRTANAQKAADAARVAKLETAVSKLEKSVAALSQSVKTAPKTAANTANTASAAAATTNAAAPAVSISNSKALLELSDRLDLIESELKNTVVPVPAATTDSVSKPLTARVEVLAEKVFTLESNLKEGIALIENGAGLPFDSYLAVTKTHIEYFVLGLVIFVVLMFLMLLSALGRAGRAEDKITQLIKLYQSSSRKIDDKK
ncbi:hypothetical protein FACS1894103_1340 [Campylobacterota bacterium]|nr:hypothetical protein FACS1894103_1340 [Campylobacterota bacterium]